MSIVEFDAAATTVRGLRPGELFDGEPVICHTLVLDGFDDAALIMGSASQLNNLADAIRREVDTIGAAPTTPEPPPADRADEQPPMLEYVVIDADGCIRLVAAALGVGGPLPVLRSAVGGHIRLVPTLPDLDGLVNAQGQLIGLPPNRVGALVFQRLTGCREPWPILGPLVLVGSDGNNAVSLTSEQRRRVVEAWAAVTYQR